MPVLCGNLAFFTPLESVFSRTASSTIQATMFFLFCILAALLSLCRSSLAEPSQYCNTGIEQHGIGDFCMAMSTYYNQSSKQYDLYISMAITRPQSSPLGWTSVGVGMGMEASLLFIIFGDPMGSRGPVLSIRRATGYYEPFPISVSAETGSPLIRLLDSAWNLSSTPVADGSPLTAIAQVSFIWYSCDSEPLFSTFSPRQPWIWAKSTEQRLSEYTDSVRLQGHSANEREGWARFYVDMAQTLLPGGQVASAPVIKPGISRIGILSRPDESASSSDQTPQRWFSRSIQVAVHSFCMSFAFLLLFPVGIFAMSSGRSMAFRYHWVLQLVGSIFVSFGLVTGVSLRLPWNSTHQVLGFIIAFGIVLQVVLGLLHHLRFLKTHSRTWMSPAHVYLGRIIFFSGCGNLITGLLLHRSPVFHIIVTALFIVIEFSAILWVTLGGRKMQWWQRVRYSSLEQADTAELLADHGPVDTKEEEN